VRSVVALLCALLCRRPMVPVRRGEPQRDDDRRFAGLAALISYDVFRKKASGGMPPADQ
jgi:hypothetical protein